MRGHKRGKSSRHRGSMLVEGALAILPLWAVLFGVVDLSVAIFVQNTVQFAVCQGVRYAVTSQTLTGLGQDASIKSVVQGYTLGFLDYLSSDRSEERRVGKECRSWWSPYHAKKNINASIDQSLAASCVLFGADAFGPSCRT